MTKLEKLAEIEGYDSVEAMLVAASTDSVVPAICKTPGCDYSEGMEPDATGGWCEECQKGTLVSCLVLYGVI